MKIQRADALHAGRATQVYPVEVSVLMPVFNAEETLLRAVQSVQQQTFNNWELLLIDDGSTDRSAAICAQLQCSDHRVRLLSMGRNQGAACARNFGLSGARGRYIAFLDADDVWLPSKLSHQLAFMRAGSHAFAYTGFWKANGHRLRRIKVPKKVTHRALMRGNVIGCLTAIYDRSVFGSVPMPDLPMRHDFALWLKLLRRHDMAAGLNAPLAIHHRRRDSLSASNAKAARALWHVYREHLGHSVAASVYFLSRQIGQRLWRG